MLTPDKVQLAATLDLTGQADRRRQFIERMERKLAHKTALRRQRRQAFRARLVRMQSWQ